MGSMYGPFSVTGGASVQAAGLRFQQFGTNAASGYVYIDSTSTVEIGTLGNAAAGALTIDSGATLSAGITTAINAQIIDNGIISAAAGGTLTLNGAISGSGMLLIGTNSLLQVAGNVAGTDTIGFAGTAAALEIGTTGTYWPTGDVAYALYSEDATIAGFAIGDSITLDNTILTGAIYTASGANLGTLALMNGTTQVASLKLAGSYSGAKC